MTTSDKVNGEYSLLVQEILIWNEKYREKHFYPKPLEKRNKLKGLVFVDGFPYWDSLEAARNKIFKEKIESIFKQACTNSFQEEICR